MTDLFELAAGRGSQPLHVTIAEQLQAAIDSGALATGERLPPERQLAASLGVSRMTVRQALGDLEREGLLLRRVGRGGGTFVREPSGDQPTEMAGLSALLRRRGQATGVEVVSASVEPARRRTAAALGLPRHARIVVVVRLRLAAGKPLAIERSSLPAHRFPDLEDMDLSGSLYDLMGSGFGLRPVRALEQLETAAARPSDARILGVRRGEPVLLVERIGYAADGSVVEFSRDRFRGDRTRVVIESSAIEE